MRLIRHVDGFFFRELTPGSGINTALPLPAFSTLLIPKVRISGVCSFFARILSGCIAYLRNVIHVNIFCDLCMDPIRGQWFHCVYCPRDLCSHCEEVDEHDRTHFSMVAKAPVRSQSKTSDSWTDLNLSFQVDMNKFYHFTGMTSEDASGPPIMMYPVFYS